MDSFTGKLAAVTGGGSGMGRELVRQLAAQGCSVAACDIHAESVAETAALARAAADERVLVTSHACDVADEAQVLRFRDDLVTAHDTDHVDLVFSNAGIGGAGSFVCDKRADWERTFAIDFWGTYYCARAFLPLLIASGDGILVNTSSVNGFWATLGPGMPNTAYSTAKFAVKGFTEALIEDLRTNAPQVTVAVVLPGHVGTDIIKNTRRILGYAGPEQMSEAELEEARPALARLGLRGRGRVPRGAARNRGQAGKPVQGQRAAQRGRGGDDHPGRGARRELADPRRRRRHRGGPGGPRPARGRLRLRGAGGGRGRGAGGRGAVAVTPRGRRALSAR